MSADPHGERGSALMLMPAGVLIVVLLGAIAVDAAVLFLGEREIADLTAAAANDAATAALAEDAFYRCGTLHLDADRAVTVVRTVAGARSSDAVALSGLQVTVRNDLVPPRVTVEAAASVPLVFTPALPGVSRVRTVGARSTAAPHELGPGGPVPGDCGEGADGDG